MLKFLRRMITRWIIYSGLAGLLLIGGWSFIEALKLLDNLLRRAGIGIEIAVAVLLVMFMASIIVTLVEKGEPDVY
jgi:hypothetical protein